MFPNCMRSAAFASLAVSLFGLTFTGAAHAESVKKQCSVKYQAAKTANTLNGQSWNQFYSQCAAQAKAGDTAPAAATPAAPAATTPAAAAPAAPAAAKPAKTVRAPSDESEAPTGSAVFPTAISPQYASLTAGKARFKTCNDQYKINKTNNGNGGLKWIQKGGGYYSECNKKLKGEN